ncbi:MAG: hypothetical protein DHS80DRAFT_18503 [Piptocephalis tieghemiana]|nr:MAG: hypothetical protein DHS80DRAFT_18503 [Piptocephalis tieghemiana]
MIIVGLLTILNSFLGLWASLDPVNRPNAVRLYPAALVIITICMVVMGLKVWVQTLTMHRDFQERWQDGTWGEDIRLAFQMGGKCCGFTTIMDNPVLSETCFLGTGAPPCAPWVWEYGDSYLRNIYTCIFALVIVDVIAFLCGVVLTEVRAEESRYIRIRGKAGSSDGLVEPPSYISATQ